MTMAGPNPLRWCTLRIDGAALAGLCFLSVVAFFLQVKPLLTERHESVQLAQNLLDAEQRLNDGKHVHQKAVAELDAVKGALAKVEVSLESVQQLNARLTRLTQIATDSQLTIDVLEPGKTTVDGAYAGVLMRLSGRGPYRACTRFIQKIDHQMPDVAITGLDLTSNSGAQEQIVSFSIDLAWYARPGSK
jgi:Tfp pilus assembly protein PilO